jgi:hypothetical protein
MGYCFVTSACINCGRLFCYNPLRVPSVRDPRTGQREPLCRACVEWANPQRIANGLEPIVPHPDAYDPVDENEVPWED